MDDATGVNRRAFPVPATVSPARATLATVHVTANPHRDEIAGYLRRADCHFGHTLREVEAALTVDQVSQLRDVGRDQVASCRHAVHRVLGGEFAANSTQASYDEAVHRALLHFRGEMSDEAHQYVLSRLDELRRRFNLATGVEPLQCPYSTGVPAKPGAGRGRESAVCPDCRMQHAGECW